MDRLLRDNEGAVIMKVPSFLICGEWIMETRNFFFPTSLLDCLYHLIMIIWPSGFNSRPLPVYFGMGRTSLWAELRYWVCSSNPFIKWAFELMFWACALGLCTYCFGPHHLGRVSFNLFL